jgi:Rad3-related DNA helicase
LDLRGDLGRFVIVAGVPHYNPTDPFDRARMKREGGMRYARWTAYNSVVQACGRVTRGVRVNGEYMLNVAALADGSAVSPAARRYYAEWFREALDGKERT